MSLCKLDHFFVIEFVSWWRQHDLTLVRLAETFFSSDWSLLLSSSSCSSSNWGDSYLISFLFFLAFFFACDETVCNCCLVRDSLLSSLSASSSLSLLCRRCLKGTAAGSDTRLNRRSLIGPSSTSLVSHSSLTISEASDFCELDETDDMTIAAGSSCFFLKKNNPYNKLTFARLYFFYFFLLYLNGVLIAAWIMAFYAITLKLISQIYHI